MKAFVAFFVRTAAALFYWVASIYNKMIGFTVGDVWGSGSDSLSEYVDNITDKMYTIIAVFMIFRLAISLLSYLVDPDKVSDKQVGGGKLIGRIVVSVVLLVSLNSIIFTTLDRIEYALLTDGAIGKLFENVQSPSSSSTTPICEEDYDTIPMSANISEETTTDKLAVVTNFTKNYSFIEPVKAANNGYSIDDSISITFAGSAHRYCLNGVPNASAVSIDAKKAFSTENYHSLDIYPVDHAVQFGLYYVVMDTNSVEEFYPYDGPMAYKLPPNLFAAREYASKGLIISIFCGSEGTNDVIVAKLTDRFENLASAGVSYGDKTQSYIQSLKQCSSDNDIGCYKVSETYELLAQGSVVDTGDILNVAVKYIYRGSNDKVKDQCDGLELSLVTLNGNCPLIEDGKTAFSLEYVITRGTTDEKEVPKDTRDCYYKYISDNAENCNKDGTICEQGTGIMNGVTVKVTYTSTDNWATKGNIGFKIESYTDKFGRTTDLGMLDNLSMNSSAKGDILNGKCPQAIYYVNCHRQKREVEEKYYCNFLEKAMIKSDKWSGKLPRLTASPDSHTYEASIGYVGQLYDDNDDFVKDCTEGQENCDTTSGQNMVNAYKINEGEVFACKVLYGFTDTDPDGDKNPNYPFTNKIVVKDAKERENFSQYVADGDVNFDTFMALIVAFGLIVFLFIICIEVIVRKLKLVLLQILSPIAVICYMNPNDKVFENWMKQYIGSFLDLFLKLIAISFAIPMMKILLDVDGGAIDSLLIYAGIFLFIKTVPNFISNIFGIKDMGGTFKEAAGLVTKGLRVAGGAGIGGAAGGIAGLVSGMGAGGGFSTIAGGLIGGLGRGIASGSKGKLFEGAKTQVSRNRAVKDSAIAGSNWFQRQRAKFGLDSATLTDNNQLKDLQSRQKEYDDFSKYKGNIDALAEESRFMKDLRQEKNKDGSAKFSEAELEKARTAFINHQLSGGTGSATISMKPKRGGKAVKRTIGIEGGKQAGIRAIMNNAEAHRSSNTTIKGVVSAPITSYHDLDKAKTDVLSKKNTVDADIIRLTNTPEYKAGDAARSGQQKK